jgi:hypothetical protein
MNLRLFRRLKEISWIFKKKKCFFCIENNKNIIIFLKKKPFPHEKGENFISE